MNSIRRHLLALELRVKINKARFLSQASNANKILFVIGTGRSGTHFLTRCLISHDEISDLTGGKENPLIFRTITAAALDQPHADPLLQKAQRVYDDLALLASPGWFADQSHPNIWFADHWSKVYPSAHFIGILRNPYSVVASMMKHRRVREWSFQWERYPVPNPFLGITAENIAIYDGLSLAQRCTLRWISHFRRLEELGRRMGNKLTVITYEDLCREPQRILANVSDRVGIANKFDLPDVDHAALTRGAYMTSEQTIDIQRLLIEAKVDQRWCRPVW